MSVIVTSVCESNGRHGNIVIHRRAIFVKRKQEYRYWEPMLSNIKCDTTGFWLLLCCYYQTTRQNWLVMTVLNACIHIDAITQHCYALTCLAFYPPTHLVFFFVQVMTFVYKICEIGRLGYSVFVFISTAIYISTNSWFKGMKRERHTFPRMVRNCYMYCKGTLIKHWWIHYMDYWIVK